MYLYRQPMPMLPQVPVVKFFSPERDDQGLIEMHDTTTAAYLPLDLGTPYRGTREYPGFKLLKQFNLPNDHKWVVRIWGKDDTNPQWFNYSVKYLAESNAHPIFIRQYREVRKTYAAKTKLQPLKSVYQLQLATAGTGYTPGTFPAVTGTGGGGSGLTGYGIVNPDGTVADLILDSGGDNFTSAPTVVIAAPPSGATATGTALLQPATALLVSEQADEFPQESEFYGLYLNVTRVYQTTPGPVLTTQSIGQDNLTPEKYRKLVTRSITEQDVAATSPFPTGLSANQTYIEQAMETIATARLKIISEIIAIGADPLTGGETNEFGALTINETVVNDATPIDAGFLVLKSSVTPFGNGKSAKITVNYPLNLALLHVLKQSIGQENLTPPKYRRLVRHVEDETMVDLSTYVLPTGLTGDQTEVRAIQETIYRARQTIISEVIAVGADPLVGQQGDQYGALAVSESIVNDGTPIDQGFLIRHSTVDPFGNGKSLKITITYLNAQIAGVKVTNGGSGGTVGTHTDGTFTGGGGSGGTFSYVVSGGVVQPGITILTPGSGYSATSLPTAVFPAAGAGIASKTFLGTPVLNDNPYDEEMQVHYTVARQIVMVGIPNSPPVNNVSEETKDLDIWRAERITTTKAPAAVDNSTALISFTTRPFAFPGLLPSTPAVVVGSNFVLIPFGFRKARADLINVKVKTWWVTSATAPVIATDEIITDTVFVFTTEDANGIIIGKRFEGVLHDALTTTYVAGSFSFTFTYAATTPSYTTYTGSWIGAEKIVACAVTPTKQANLWKVQQELIVMR